MTGNEGKVSPYLAKELYAQVKRVISRPIALVDPTGQAFSGLSDFAKIRQFRWQEAPSREKSSLAVADRPELRAIPIYHEDRLALLVVVAVAAEDSQTIQMIASLAELLVQQFVTSHKPRPDAVDLLLTRVAYRPDTIDDEELEQQMAAFGYELGVQRAAVIFELTGFWQNYLQTVGAPLADKKNLIAAKKNDIERVLRSFFSRNQDNVVGYVGHDQFLVLKDLSGADFEQFCELLQNNYEQIVGPLKNIHIKNVTVGIGAPASSAGGLLASAEEALQVLQVGSQLSGPNAVYRRDVLGVLPLLIGRSLESKTDQARALLSPIAADAELLETLQTFLNANLNLTQTAERLKVHRNTVIYRLEKLAEAVSKDPRRFSDAVELYLALQLTKVFPSGNAAT